MVSGVQLSALLAAAKAKLLADSYFSDVDVLTEDDGDIATDLAILLKKLKVCVVLGDVVATNKRPNATAPIWWPLNFTAVISEQVVLNRARSSYKAAVDIADKVADVMTGLLSDDALGTWGHVAARSCREIASKSGYQVYEVEFQIGE